MESIIPYRLPCGCLLRVSRMMALEIVDEHRCAYHSSQEYKAIVKAMNGSPLSKIKWDEGHGC